MTEFIYVFSILEEKASELYDIAALVRNYNYTVDFDVSKGAFAVQMQQSVNELKELGEAIAKLCESTGAVFNSAAEQMREADEKVAVEIQLA